MGLPSSFVLSGVPDRLWTVRGGRWTAKEPASSDMPRVPHPNVWAPDMSTNRRSYPQGETPYPHF